MAAIFTDQRDYVRTNGLNVHRLARVICIVCILCLSLSIFLYLCVCGKGGGVGIRVDSL